MKGVCRIGKRHIALERWLPGRSAQHQSPAKMKQLLCSTADDIKDPNEGCGRLNVYRAMATVLGDSKLP
jgi:hypothetical protein